MDALKSNRCVPFSQIVFLLLLQDGAGSRLHLLHSFDSGCYHHNATEIMLQFMRLSITLNIVNQRDAFTHMCSKNQHIHVHRSM